MATDYISREAAKKHQDKIWQEIRSVLKGKVTKLAEAVYRDLKNSLDDVPAADVRPVVSGEWIVNRFENHTLCECYACGQEFYYFNKGQYHIDESNFCPHCGANMRGVGK